MAKKAYRVILAVGFVVLSGCWLNLENFAEKALYPFESVNKKYRVQEQAPPGFEQMYFPFVSAVNFEEINVHAWAYRNPGNLKRVIVYFHGNGENLQSLYEVNFFKRLADDGFSFIAIDYPGYGRSIGTPNQESLIKGGLESLAWARETFPNYKIIVWGRSLGAGVAAQVASRGRSLVDGLILMSGWNRFIDLAISKTNLASQLSDKWVRAHDYNSMSAMSDFFIPTVLFHGDRDTTIPLEFGQKLSQAFPGENKMEFQVLKGFAHNDVYRSPEVWQKLRAFLK
jgi:pimeloyl-ACP methyl ester carboxylesterase